MSSKNDDDESNIDSGHAVRIREARPEDLRLINMFCRQAVDSYSLSPYNVADLFRLENILILIAEKDRVLGFVAGRLKRHICSRSGTICALVSHTGERGGAIARLLLEKMLIRFNALGVEHAYLEVEEEKTGALELFKDLGFEFLDYGLERSTGALTVRLIHRMVKNVKFLEKKGRSVKFIIKIA